MKQLIIVLITCLLMGACGDDQQCVVVSDDAGRYSCKLRDSKPFP